MRVGKLSRAFVLANLVVAGLTACGGSSGGTRQVLVDYSPDEVATFVPADFPEKVVVRPGQTILFKQTWTGEPHTVTGGTSISASLRATTDWLAFFNGYDELHSSNPTMIDPDDAGDATWPQLVDELRRARPAADANATLAAYARLVVEHPTLPPMTSPPDVLVRDVVQTIENTSNEAFEGVPFASTDFNGFKESVARPCFLNKGGPPADDNTACTKEQQRQPAFNGRQSFYNSGVLKFEGARGNDFPVRIAKDATPGTYFFYCAIHGAGQSMRVQIAKPNASVPSASDVRHAARREAEASVKPLVRLWEQARKTNHIRFQGQTLDGPFAGIENNARVSVLEFVPRRLETKVNEPITWTVMGRHTISFDVPPYAPIIQFRTKDIRYNPVVMDRAGGAPAPPAENEEGDVPDYDAGTYDGTGFWSTGLVGSSSSMKLTLRISKPGTYPYACLVHPKMIGQIVVSPS